MGWLEPLLGKSVGIDTAPLIYYIEDHHQYAQLMEPFFRAVSREEIAMVTSIITLTEVLTHPLRKGDEKLAQTYNEFLLTSAGVTTVSVNTAIAQSAAEIRAEHRLKTPDAIHLATAISLGADAFLTNDRDFGNATSLPILRLKELKN